MSPPAAQQALTALKIIMGEDEQAGALGTARMAKLRENSNRFRAGLIRIGCRVLGDADSPVIPIMLYHPEKIYNFSQAPRPPPCPPRPASFCALTPSTLGPRPDRPRPRVDPPAVC